jgi:protein-S-isoprenylcysteine O-methyltransferase Ste14
MPKKMSRWGVGPRILGAALAYAILAGAATHLFPGYFLVRIVPNYVFTVVGIALLCVGVPMLAVAARAGMRAYNRGQLATSGIYGFVRNPMYSAWILFVIPGLVVLTRSWPLFLTPFFAYAAFKLLIPREYEYLQQKFGDTYADYASQVNEILPWRRIRQVRKP